MIFSRFFAASILFSLSVYPCLSQSKFEIGFKAGLNFSTFSGYEPTPNQSYLTNPSPVEAKFFSLQYDEAFTGRIRLGKSYSFFGNYKLLKKLSIQSALEYNERGMDLDVTRTFSKTFGNENWYNAFSISKEIKNTYLTIPLQLKYSTEESKIAVYGTCGAYFDFLIHSEIASTELYYGIKEAGQPPETSMMSIGQQDIKGEAVQTANFDFGLILSGGLEVPLNQTFTIILNVNYSQGFLQLDKKYDNDLKTLVGTSGSITNLRNYYGLNSNSKNICIGNSVGVVYKL